MPQRVLEVLRQAAQSRQADIADQRALVGALIGRGDAASLAQAQELLVALESRGDVSRQWICLMRAAVAEAGGENGEAAEVMRAVWLDALSALPPEVGRVHLSSGEQLGDGSFGARASSSYKPDDYVAVAFEARFLGVKETAGRFSYDFRVDARLFDNKGSEVQGFTPPAFNYRGKSDFPFERQVWFEFVLQQRLPRDLAPGIYTVEIGLTDCMGKAAWGRVTGKLELHIR